MESQSGNLPGLPDRLAQTLGEAAGRLREAGGTEAERLLGLLRSALEALRSVAAVVDAPRDLSSAPETVEQWLHELREPVTAIAGWTQILVATPDQSKRVRAGEAIERNARQLTELLSRPPV